MNVPNLITLSRIPLLFVIVFLLFLPLPWMASAAFVCYLLAGLTDWLDGYVARRNREISTFGKFIDALMDKILILGLCITLLALSIVPPWTIVLVLMMLIREFLISGLRAVAATKGTIIAAERWGKYKTILQLISLGVFLFYHMLKEDLVRVCPSVVIDTFYYLGLLSFCMAAGMTITSGIHYLMRYKQLLIDEMHTTSG